jgi:hypothetical protein
VKAGDTLSGIAQAAYGDMTLWGGVWEANKAKLPSAATPHNLPAGTVLSLPRFDTEAAKTSARNARHAAPAFTGTGAAAANAKPVAYGNGFEYLPVAFTLKQLETLSGKTKAQTDDEMGMAYFYTQWFTYGGTQGWHIAASSGKGGSESEGLLETIKSKNPGLLQYALGYQYDSGNMDVNFSYKGEFYSSAGGLPGGVKDVRYVLVKAAQ